MELDWLLAPPLPEAVPRQRVLYLRLREAIRERSVAGRHAPARQPQPRGDARHRAQHGAVRLRAARRRRLSGRGSPGYPSSAAFARTRRSPCRRIPVRIHRRCCPHALRRRCSASPRATPKPCRSRPACRISAPFPSAPGVPASNVRGARRAGVSSVTPRTVASRACARRSRPT